MGAKQSSFDSTNSPYSSQNGSPVRRASFFSEEDNYSSKAYSNIGVGLVDQIAEEDLTFKIGELITSQTLDENYLTYGGNFSWVDAHYKMKVATGMAPLQWMNALTKRMLVLNDISLAADGTFVNPRDKALMFPKRGIDLKWRYDAEKERIIIDFFDATGKRMTWRWDELKPRAEMTFPSTAPDLDGTGHVGKYTFKYEFLSAVGISGEGIDSFSSEGSDCYMLGNLEPVTRDGRSFTWWNNALAEERKRSGVEGSGSIFAAPPDDAVIGEGSFGVVWLARHKDTGVQYAVKNVFAKNGRRNNNNRAMAQNEFEVVEKILTKPHPNIVSFYTLDSFSVARGELYVLVMEYCCGGDLQGVLNKCANDNAKKKYTAPAESMLWLAQIFCAVEHIHTKLNLLLRDLKPCNVILSTPRCAKLTDFGFGRLVADSPGGQWTFSVPPSSPGYAAPEILAQESYSYPVDIYGLGVITWVLLSGGAREMPVPAPPTRGQGGNFTTYVSDWKLLAEALEDQRKARCEIIDASAIEVISEMTQKNPSDRPTIQALREKPFFCHKVLPFFHDAA